MKKTDKQLGMDRDITRRDFIHDLGVATVGLGLASRGWAGPMTDSVYPPTLTGMRGSQPGSYEVAHALRDGARIDGGQALDEEYDLVVVGSGISGLAAAYLYQQRFGDKARILILENHDDFGGHARRNEFHQGGKMRLSLGGTHNLEHWDFSRTVNRVLKELGIDIKDLLRNKEYNYGYDARNGVAAWFDKESFGQDKLVTQYTLENWVPGMPLDCIDEIPISDAGRTQLRTLYESRENVLPGRSEDELWDYLTTISYPDFLRRHAGVSEEVVELFATSQHGAWGVELRALSAAEGLESGLPGLNLVGMEKYYEAREYPVAMYPDGNASVARLFVHRLIPAVSPGANADNIAMAKFDYGKLDAADSPVRLRLNATVVNAQQRGEHVETSYVQGGKVYSLRSRHCVMACYHSIIPHLCPQMPEAQKAAQKYQVKIPLVLTNVLLRSNEPMDKLGIDNVRTPGRLHADMFMFRGINTGGYSHPMAENGPVPLVFWGSISPPPEAVTAKDQFRASRNIMLGLEFEDYEREVRRVLDGLLGPVGFDVQKDILAITVNRWPHGYSYEYMQLWDPEFEKGEAPHEIASQPFGNITIANSDAGASAYTHVAIDEAYRAIKELPRS